MEVLTPHDLAQTDDWAALVCVRVLPNPTEEEAATGRIAAHKKIPIGFVFVIERHRHNPLWKFPGGHRKNGESPEETGTRELRGETGLNVQAVTLVDKWLAGGKGHTPLHWKILFCVDVWQMDLAQLNRRDPENEGEEPEFFTLAETWRLVRGQAMMREHGNKLTSLNLLPKAA